MSITAAYESLLVHNLSAVRTLESTLRNVTWFLPGRFEDAEVASEGLYALLNVVSSYHDTLLSHRLSPKLSLPGRPFPAASDEEQRGEGSSRQSSIPPVLPPPSDHARYTRYWTSKSPLYRKASRVLVTLSYVELLLEMLARKRGDRARWRLVLWIEGIKTFLRLILLRLTKRPVLYPPSPQREIDISTLPSTVLDPPKPSELSAGAMNGDAKPIIPTMPPHAPLRSHLYPMASALPAELLAHPLALLPPLSTSSAYVSEVLTSSATLIQVILLLRASVSRPFLSDRTGADIQRRPSSPTYKRLSLPTLSRNLTPFVIPLILRLVARRLRQPPKDSLLLAEHYAALDRKLAMSFFFTGPMWVGWTRPKIAGITGWIKRIPLLGVAGELVEGYLPLVDDYYYYTSS